jgi:very-short-patch-repair endonuclease
MGRKAQPLLAGEGGNMHDRHHHSGQRLLEFRAALLSQPTFSEQVLWPALKGKRLGTAFRRQAPLAGAFIVDFLAPAKRLVVEVDGPCHARKRAADARRDRRLGRLGYRVLRLEAEVVVRHLPVALERIREALQALA